MESTWAARFRALADDTRLVLLAALLDDELSVGELAEVIDAPQPGVSRHLSALAQAGLVVSRKQGTATFCRLAQGEELLEGAFAAELGRIARGHKLSSRIERVLARRAAKGATFFDRAEDWDTLRAELFADSAGLASLVPLLPRDLVVADVGTGTGGMLPYLAEVAREIVAVDLSAEMLRRARATARRLGLDNVRFMKGELGALPLGDASVDAAYAALVLHHAPRPMAALRELVRITRPGGAVVVVDLVSHGHEWLRDEQADVWLGFDRDELVELATRAGLSRVTHRVVSRAPVKKGTGAPLELFVLAGHKNSSRPS